MELAMKLAASNIGWAPETKAPGTRDIILPQLYARGVRGLVIAPSMVWEGAPDSVSAAQAATFRAQVEEHGLQITGMQSLTFGMGEGLNLASPEVTDRLKRQAELAGQLGATSMILGSPNLRQTRPNRDTDYTPTKVINALANVAEVAAANNTKLCIEPLSGYGVQHITNIAEGVELKWSVNDQGIWPSKGFGLHLDSAALAGDPGFDPSLGIAFAQRTRGIGITSFDASAPDLMPPSQDTTVPHSEIAAALRREEFRGFVSLEMRQPQDPNNPNFDPIAAYLAEVDFVSQQYGFQQ